MASIIHSISWMRVSSRSNQSPGSPEWSSCLSEIFREGAACHNRATRPATWGVDMEVPEIAR